jgi:RNA polymerase sigma-70 factor (ECF subfamily)
MTPRQSGAGADRSRDHGVARPDSSAAAEFDEAVARARHRDEDAFRLIYRSVQPGLLRYVRSLVGEEAEDVAAETWAQIARDIATFHGDGDGFRGWAATIARHRAMDYLRRVRRRPVAAFPVEDLTDYWVSRDDTLLLADTGIGTRAALAMIASLPPDQAEAVLLRVVMGLTAETAAQVLGKRAGAVRTAAHRGLRRLADQVEQSALSRHRDLHEPHRGRREEANDG